MKITKAWNKYDHQHTEQFFMCLRIFFLWIWEFPLKHYSKFTKACQKHLWAHSDTCWRWKVARVGFALWLTHTIIIFENKFHGTPCSWLRITSHVLWLKCEVNFSVNIFRGNKSLTFMQHVVKWCIVYTLVIVASYHRSGDNTWNHHLITSDRVTLIVFPIFQLKFHTWHFKNRKGYWITPVFETDTIIIYYLCSSLWSLLLHFHFFNLPAYISVFLLNCLSPFSLGQILYSMLMSYFTQACLICSYFGCCRTTRLVK